MSAKIKKALGVVRDVLTDPGFGFSATAAILFYGTNPVGLGATIIAASAITAIKALNAAAPSFLKKENKLSRFITDPRTPLNLLASAMVLVTGLTLLDAVSLATAAPNLAQLLTSADFFTRIIVPSVTAATFAIGDFVLAAQLGRVKALEKSAVAKCFKAAVTNQKPPKKEVIRSILNQPEPYFTVGMMGAGLMAGGFSALAFPLVLAGGGMTIFNSLRKKAEHEGHPKLYYAGGAAIFGAVGFATGNIAPAIANMLDAPYLVVCEAETTPGGWKTLAKDLKTAFAKITGHPVKTQERGPAPQAGYTAPALLTSLPMLKEKFPALHLAAKNDTRPQVHAAAKNTL